MFVKNFDMISLIEMQSKEAGQENQWLYEARFHLVAVPRFKDDWEDNNVVNVILDGSQDKLDSIEDDAVIHEGWLQEHRLVKWIRVRIYVRECDWILETMTVEHMVCRCMVQNTYI